MCEYIHASSKYWLNFYDEAATVLDTGQKTENKTNEAFVFTALTV